jgi:carboxylesterase type B
MGESAGGGSIMHQVTAYGGNAGPSPFKQAILQSPGWIPITDGEQPEQTLQQFLGILNVSTIEEARKLSSERLISANAYQIATKSQWGSFIYGPVVDGSFVPQLPGKLLAEGNFDRNLNIMVGHNADEGLVFTSPDSRNESGLAALLHQQFPYMKKNVSDYISNVLYPPKYDGSYGYTSPVTRTALAISDLIFVCNTDYFNRAYHNQTFAYEFSIPPALHGQDVQYTFYNNGSSATGSFLSVQNITVAEVMQDYFTSFAQCGEPRSPLGPAFHRYSQRGSLMNIGNHTISPERDPTDNPRCRFWQTAPFT